MTIIYLAPQVMNRKPILGRTMTKLVCSSILATAIFAIGVLEADGATVVNQWTDIRSRACTNPHEYGCVNSDWYHGGGYYLIDPLDRARHAPKRKHRHHPSEVLGND